LLAQRPRPRVKEFEGAFTHLPGSITFVLHRLPRARQAPSGPPRSARDELAAARPLSSRASEGATVDEVSAIARRRELRALAAPIPEQRIHDMAGYRRTDRQPIVARNKRQQRCAGLNDSYDSYDAPAKESRDDQGDTCCNQLQTRAASSSKARVARPARL